MGRLHQEAGALQAFHRTSHGQGIAIYKAVGIQKPRLPPDFAHSPNNIVGYRIIIIADHDIDQEKPAPVQPRFHQLEKTLRQQMGRNDRIRESIQDNGVITILGAAQEVRAIPRMAIHGLRHVEIAPGNLEGQRVNVHQCHLHTCTGQHGGQSAAGTTDHQDMARLLLQHQAEKGMDILRQTDASPVRDALMIPRLPIGNAACAVVLGQNDFGELSGQARLASGAAYRPRRNRK